MIEENATKKIVVYTAIIGKRDVLNENIITSPNCDYICFTDNTNLKSNIWTIKQVTYTHENPRKVARHYKVLAHQYLSDYEYSVWVDGHCTITGDIEKFVYEALGEEKIAVFKHPDKCRDCIYKEAIRCIIKRKDSRQIILDQVDRYKDAHYPENNGLIASGIIVRLHNDQKIIDAMQAWWHEIDCYSVRDQISFNYIAWKHKLKISLIEESIFMNEYFKFKNHKKRNIY